jgi:hypothetical protein
MDTEIGEHGDHCERKFLIFDNFNITYYHFAFKRVINCSHLNFQLSYWFTCRQQAFVMNCSCLLNFILRRVYSRNNALRVFGELGG